MVVRPTHPPGPARIVPVGRAEPAEGELCLDCTLEEAQRFESIQEFAYLRIDATPIEDPDWDVGVEDVLAMPYYGNGDIGGYVPTYDENVRLSYDRIPKGQVEIRRASAVTSADGEDVGHVDGFVVDDDDQITHIVLQHGHLWRKREVTIPIGAVAAVETDNVRLSLTTQQVGALV